MTIAAALEALRPPYKRQLDEDGVMVGVSRQALHEMLEHIAANGVEKALEVAFRYAGIGGDHHKAWVIDQMVRALTGDQYANWVHDACIGENGDADYTWSAGIPP